MARTPSATDRAYAETRDRILDGSYPGGQVITEGQVSTALGISRTPVREAFLRLQTEGLLQLYPKRGAVVAHVTMAEFEPVMEARSVIEIFAVTKVLTENCEPPASLITALWELVGEMGRRLRARDATGYTDADDAFHLTIVAASGNPFLEQLSRTLHERQRRLVRHVAAEQSRAEASYPEHVAIVEQLETGDLDATLARIRAHLRSGRQSLGLLPTAPFSSTPPG